MDQTGFDPTHLAAILIPMMFLGLISSTSSW